MKFLESCLLVSLTILPSVSAFADSESYLGVETARGAGALPVQAEPSSPSAEQLALDRAAREQLARDQAAATSYAEAQPAQIAAPVVPHAVFQECECTNNEGATYGGSHHAAAYRKVIYSDGTASQNKLIKEWDARFWSVAGHCTSFREYSSLCGKISD